VSLEAQQVVGLRLGLLAVGGASTKGEVSRMVSEKVPAALEAQRAAAVAALPNIALIP
jgi:hypothetical protein